MPLTLYCTRAKSFVDQTEGTKKFLLQAGPHPTPAPFWVAETPTFKQGIKDKSIINLTPPEHMPGYKPAKAAVVEEPEGGAPVIEEADIEQTEVPQAAFGGQPMTPVTPAPKVGNVTASSKRTR